MVFKSSTRQGRVTIYQILALLANLTHWRMAKKFEFDGTFLIFAVSNN